MKEFTVIGFYEESLQIFSHHVKAENSMTAFAVLSKQHSDAVFTAVIDSCLNEGEGIEFPGSSLVGAETVLSQPEVFGTGDPTFFRMLIQKLLNNKVTHKLETLMTLGKSLRLMMMKSLKIS
jgi:hypothetical protein